MQSEMTDSMIPTLFCQAHLIERLQNIREPLHLLKNEVTSELGFLLHSEYENSYEQLQQHGISHFGILPAIYPEWLGDHAFLSTHGVRFPYIVGEMANGIATAEMVIAAAKSGLLGFFGAAGLSLELIEKNLQTIKQRLDCSYTNWGANLIHSPHQPELEERTISLYLKHDLQRISASAYMTLSPHIVHYVCKGLHLDDNGNIQRRNHVLAKVSRPEVAKLFMSPAPPALLAHLVATGKITQEEATFAAYIPVAGDITVEADSGDIPITDL